MPSSRISGHPQRFVVGLASHQVPHGRLPFGMPDNTWFNPYKLSHLKRLSSGPSQGIVYQVDDGSVIKVPFQYPVDEGSTTDEKADHLVLSLKSFNCFKQECRIYELLSKSPHPNVVTSFQCNKPHCLVLERVQPLQEAWKNSTTQLRETWILELLDVLSFLEGDLQYLHGDISIFNIGIGHDNRLKIFDFGSAAHKDDEDFEHQIVEDQSNLATCIFYLASGIDPFAEVKSSADINRVQRDLQEARIIFPAGAERFQGVIEACWSQKRFDYFENLRRKVADILQIQTARKLVPLSTPISSLGYWKDSGGRSCGWMRQSIELRGPKKTSTSHLYNLRIILSSFQCGEDYKLGVTNLIHSEVLLLLRIIARHPFTVSGCTPTFLGMTMVLLANHKLYKVLNQLPRYSSTVTISSVPSAVQVL